MTTAHWSNPYVGIPYLDLGRTRAGVDCLGLVKLVYGEQLGIELPGYDGLYVSAEEAAEVDALIAGAESAWTAVDTLPRAFDVLVFRRGVYRRHLGLVISPGMMLHADDDTVRVEHYLGGKWSCRLVGTYRHRARGTA